MEKQESAIHIQGKNQSKEIDSSIPTCWLGSADRTFKQLNG